MTNINPFKIIMKVRTAMWYLFFLTIGVWLLSSCEQKELCYDHNHASNVKVTFDWEQHPNANPASMCFYLFPREEGERTLKREFIGKNGGIAQALVGVSYTALGFNSDARNTSFRNNIRTNSIEASSKDAGTIDRIGISASLLPRAKGTEGERMSMEADSIYSGASEKDILISLEENDRGDTCKITLSPKRRFCTYRLKIINIANQQNLSSSIAGSISGLAGGINLSTGEKTEAKVTVPFAVGTTNESTLEGQLRCYGNSPSEDAANYLVIYTMLKDGTKWCYIYDVTKQIKEAPNPYEVEILQLIYQANASKKKVAFLSSCRVKLIKVRLQIRVAKDLKQLHLNQYGLLAEMQENISKQLSGWEKSERRKEKESKKEDNNNSNNKQ